MTLSHPNTHHSLRRGKLWRFLDMSEYVDDPVDTSATTSAANQEIINKLKDMPNLGYYTKELEKYFAPNSMSVASPSPMDIPALQDKAREFLNLAANSKYGFQFLWNPDTFNVSVDVNMNVTPTVADRFNTVVKAFPSMQSLSFTIVLDRTNDFACFRGLRNNGRYNRSSLSSYKDYYPHQFGSMDESFEYQLENLLRLGTLADLEYLFRTINGNLEFETVLGRKTADIGFLTPSQVALQLGPTADSLTYTGWINNLNIQHVAFTEEMIPIRTLVSVTMPTFTNQGSGTSN